MKKPANNKKIFKIIIRLLAVTFPCFILFLISTRDISWMRVLTFIEKVLSSNYFALSFIVVAICITFFCAYNLYNKRKILEHWLDHEVKKLSITKKAKNDELFIKSLSHNYKPPLIRKRLDILEDNLYKEDEITNDDKDDGDDISDTVIVLLEDYLKRKNGC